MEPESSLPYSQAPATYPYLVRDASPRNTPPPEIRVEEYFTVLSPEEASHLWVFLNILFFTARSC